MAEKNILCHFNRAPFGTIFNTEGFRAAVGCAAGIDEHKATLLFQGDGVYYALKDVDRTENRGYMGTLKDLECDNYFVVSEDLDARGIGSDEIADDMKVISRDESVKLYGEADVIMDW